MSVGPASHARKTIVAFGASLAFISFLDRAAISQAAPSITRDLHLSSIQMGSWPAFISGKSANGMTRL
jgi:hypothetical protein